MRQLILIVIIVVGLNSYGQSISYSFKFEGVTDIALAKNVLPSTSRIFDDRPVFVTTTEVFFIKSDIDIDEDDFTAKMLNNGYVVTFFEKNYGKIDEEHKP